MGKNIGNVDRSTFFTSILLLLIIIILVYFYIFGEKTIFSSYYGSKYVEAPLSNDELEEIKDVSIIFVVPCYNADILLLKERLNYLVEGFNDYRIYLGGSDSSRQETIQAIEEWSDDKVINCKIIKKITSNRIARISNVRNQMLNVIKRDLFGSVVVAVYDGDHDGPMSKRGLIKSINYLFSHPQVYGVSGTGKRAIIPGLLYVTYDKFAYESCPWNRKEKFRNDVYQECLSSFSGCCIYRLNEYIQGNYESNGFRCEHCVFNENLRLKFGGWMVQNKDWCLLTGGVHSQF